jgi:hypothetical protein
VWISALALFVALAALGVAIWAGVSSQVQAREAKRTSHLARTPNITIRLEQGVSMVLTSDRDLDTLDVYLLHDPRPHSAPAALRILALHMNPPPGSTRVMRNGYDRHIQLEEVVAGQSYPFILMADKGNTAQVVRAQFQFVARNDGDEPWITTQAIDEPYRFTY